MDYIACAMNVVRALKVSGTRRCRTAALVARLDVAIARCLPKLVADPPTAEQALKLLSFLLEPVSVASDSHVIRRHIDRVMGCGAHALRVVELGVIPQLVDVLSTGGDGTDDGDPASAASRLLVRLGQLCPFAFEPLVGLPPWLKTTVRIRHVRQRRIHTFTIWATLGGSGPPCSTASVLVGALKRMVCDRSVLGIPVQQQVLARGGVELRDDQTLGGLSLAPGDVIDLVQLSTIHIYDLDGSSGALPPHYVAKCYADLETSTPVQLCQALARMGVDRLQTCPRCVFRGEDLLESGLLSSRGVHDGCIVHIDRRAASYLPMRIFVKTLGGAITLLTVRPSFTISHVKDVLLAKLGTPPQTQRLIFAGRELEDQRTLLEYSVQKESTLFMILKRLAVVEGARRSPRLSAKRE